MGDIVQTSEYIAIIRRAEFVDLFKYGYLFLPHSVRLDRPMREGEGRDTFDELVRWMPTYEYSFEYLLIRFLDSDEDILVRTVHIEQVMAVYTFDERALHELSISFDPRIKIQVSVWKEWFHEKWKQSFRQQCELGVVAIWSLFCLSDEDKRVCEETISKEIKDQIFELIFSGRRPKGELPAWVYLFLYERHAFYPKDKNRGYFLDYIHIYLSVLEGKEQDIDVRDTTIEAVTLLEGAKSDTFSALQDSIASSTLHVKANEKAPYFHDTAPLFLYLKSRCVEGFDQTLLEAKTKAALMNEPYKRLALYLLGLALGYDKVYDVYYDKLPLSIFSDKPKLPATLKKRVCAPSTQSHIPAKRRIDPKPEANTPRMTPLASSPIAWMKPKDERLRANITIRPVCTDEEKRQLEESEGYTSLTKRQFNCICVQTALEQYGYKAIDEGERLFPVVNKHKSKQDINSPDYPLFEES